ncbi:hypothetical protein LTR37_006406 [Vermiconidia calcicola]|uniref:Uncharacterized protein n=1 Tax=Vermiconidia calcicola TaxID=1690605 RepID=A0ACC3NGZ2_9PEZI|nr:hypothetical protein LTR37_006406 [Vermiconidia calcicola]
MPESPKPVSFVEVERKFVPTTYLKARLNGTARAFESSGPSDCSTPAGSHATSQLSFFRLPDKRIRDTYYDSRDRLSSKGIWVRQRTSQVGGSQDFPLVSTGPPSTKWEAKVRLAGDYADSQFLELQGEAEIRSLQQQHLPEVQLERLQILADLETHRKTWVVHEPSGWSFTSRAVRRITKTELRIDLDEVTTPGDASGEGRGFQHQIGEVEVTAEVAGAAIKHEDDVERSRVAKSMHGIIDEFFKQHSSLFVSTTKPKGKLEAFFDWKRDAPRVGNQEEAGRVHDAIPDTRN